MNVLEAAEHPQTKARNMLVEAGGVRVSGNPIKISGYEDPPTRAAAPTLNQHGDVLRREFAVPSHRSSRSPQKEFAAR
jgi:CoA:oxalate CoA-transferase